MHWEYDHNQMPWHRLVPGDTFVARCAFAYPVSDIIEFGSEERFSVETKVFRLRQAPCFLISVTDGVLDKGGQFIQEAHSAIRTFIFISRHGLLCFYA